MAANLFSRLKKFSEESRVMADHQSIAPKDEWWIIHIVQWVRYVGIELLWQPKIICDAEVSVDRYWDQAKWVPREAMPWGIQLAFAPLFPPSYISTYWIRCLPSCLYLCPLVNVIFSHPFQLWLTLTGELVKHFQQFEADWWLVTAERSAEVILGSTPLSAVTGNAVQVIAQEIGKLNEISAKTTSE